VSRDAILTTSHIGAPPLLRDNFIDLSANQKPNADCRCRATYFEHHRTINDVYTRSGHPSRLRLNHGDEQAGPSEREHDIKNVGDGELQRASSI